jgi:hypothetical protein
LCGTLSSKGGWIPRLRPDLGERPSPLLEVIRAHVVEDAFAHQLLGRVARYPLYRGADVAYGAPASTTVMTSEEFCTRVRKRRSLS